MDFNQARVNQAAAEYRANQRQDTPVTFYELPYACLRYAFARSSESQQLDQPGQDYLAWKASAGRMVFCACDGVGSSFAPQLAAQSLGDRLVDWLFDLPDETARSAGAVQRALAGKLEDWVADGRAAVEQIALPPDLPPLMRGAMENLRDEEGSETLFVCGRIEASQSGPPQVLLLFAGDLFAQVRDRQGQPLETGFERINANRWSTRRGMRGQVAVWMSEAGCPPAHLLFFSDGLAHSAAQVASLDDWALQEAILQSALLINSDDICVLDIRLKTAEPTASLEAPGAISASPETRAVVFEWPRVPGARGYEFQNDSLPDFQNCEPVHTRAPTVRQPVEPGAPRYLRVRALTGDQAPGPWSRVFPYLREIAAPPPLALREEAGTGAQTFLTWDKATGARYYVLEEWAAGGEPRIAYLGADTRWTLPEGLPASTHYRVRAVSAAGLLAQSGGLCSVWFPPLPALEMAQADGTAEPPPEQLPEPDLEELLIDYDADAELVLPAPDGDEAEPGIPADFAGFEPELGLSGAEDADADADADAAQTGIGDSAQTPQPGETSQTQAAQDSWLVWNGEVIDETSEPLAGFDLPDDETPDAASTRAAGDEERTGLPPEAVGEAPGYTGKEDWVEEITPEAVPDRPGEPAVLPHPRVKVDLHALLRIRPFPFASQPRQPRAKQGRRRFWPAAGFIQQFEHCKHDRPTQPQPGERLSGEQEPALPAVLVPPGTPGLLPADPFPESGASTEPKDAPQGVTDRETQAEPGQPSPQESEVGDAPEAAAPESSPDEPNDTTAQAAPAPPIQPANPKKKTRRQGTRQPPVSAQDEPPGEPPVKKGRKPGSRKPRAGSGAAGSSGTDIADRHSTAAQSNEQPVEAHAKMDMPQPPAAEQDGAEKAGDDPSTEASPPAAAAQTPQDAVTWNDAAVVSPLPGERTLSGDAVPDASPAPEPEQVPGPIVAPEGQPTGTTQPETSLASRANELPGEPETAGIGGPPLDAAETGADGPTAEQSASAEEAPTDAAPVEDESVTGEPNPSVGSLGQPAEKQQQHSPAANPPEANTGTEAGSPEPSAEPDSQLAADTPREAAKSQSIGMATRKPQDLQASPVQSQTASASARDVPGVEIGPPAVVPTRKKHAWITNARYERWRKREDQLFHKNYRKRQGRSRPGSPSISAAETVSGAAQTSAEDQAQAEAVDLTPEAAAPGAEITPGLRRAERASPQLNWLRTLGDTVRRWLTAPPAESSAPLRGKSIKSVYHDGMYVTPVVTALETGGCLIEWGAAAHTERYAVTIIGWEPREPGSGGIIEKNPTSFSEYITGREPQLVTGNELSVTDLLPGRYIIKIQALSSEPSAEHGEGCPDVEVVTAYINNYLKRHNIKVNRIYRRTNDQKITISGVNNVSGLGMERGNSYLLILEYGSRDGSVIEVQIHFLNLVGWQQNCWLVKIARIRCCIWDQPQRSWG